MSSKINYKNILIDILDRTQGWRINKDEKGDNLLHIGMILRHNERPNEYYMITGFEGHIVKYTWFSHPGEVELKKESYYFSDNTEVVFDPEG